MFLTIHSPAVENGCRNGIHRRRRAPITYDQVSNSYKNNNLTRFQFKLAITMLFSYRYGQQQIGDNKKCRHIAGDFDCHTDAAVQHRAQPPIEHIQGFTWSHWMPPLSKCLCRIAPAATMVDEFVENTLNTNKTHLLPSNYGTFDCQLFVRISYPEMDLLLSSLMQQFL